MRYHYVIGTAKAPDGLIRLNRAEPPDSFNGPAYERWDPDAGAWIPAPEMGRYIVLGDTMLTKVDADQVAGIVQRLRVRVGAD